jgi:hypothetical protein
VDPISEDAVFEAVRAAVEAGEYTDYLPAARAQGRNRGAAEGEPARNAPDGGYLRGTPEHRQARALGLAARLPRPPVAAAGAVQAVEQATGCPLPRLLRRLFLEVANGGFGPGYGGTLGVPGDQGRRYPGDWDDLLHVHRAFGGGPGPHVPRHMLWLYEWGCCTWSLVDCSSPEGVMWVWDPNGAGQSLFCQEISLTEWLAAWLQGRLRMPEITQDAIPSIPGQLTLFNPEPGSFS